ncbi:MarR family winged helix-turn-helix transcriptional regulator [Salinactinospora qingdaonensis]|uniref:HTH marR-type domain-containing protein n=1 Tax=Salinactinospora qingdaonensis TaxID=702744 RepID=A0ABP7GCK9_9ACTN
MDTAPDASRADRPRSPEPAHRDDDTAGQRSREALYRAIQVDGQRLATGLIRLLHAMSENVDLNPTDFQCYVLLKIGGPMTPGEIASGLKLATGSVTGVIDRLEARGLVRRARHTEDRRKVVVELDEDAEVIEGGAGLGMREAMIALHDSYSEEQLELIADWLNRIGSALVEVASGNRRT